MSVLFAFALSIASAQTTDADAEARDLFETGRIAYEDGEFERALASFRRAYELSGRPELLYNVAASYDRLRDDRAAIEWFERYLAAVPDAANRASVERRLEILRGSVAPAESGGLSAWPFVFFGASALFAGLSVLWWALAEEADADLEASCSPACTPDDIDESGGPGLVTLTNVFVIAAIAAAAGGAVGLALDLVLAGEPEAPSAALRLGPLPTLIARF